ncbi:hypothetical protein B2J93_7281 [Marssonina coronariae]|uniref:Uncharacterized protein n=1 Tax=Diplocarpon coronariae TaxID=2795749 RepID=A0A218ZBK6_9HELO|nr:hypothetical protein B2J93_7281 [Marssonina coronariae]
MARSDARGAIPEYVTPTGHWSLHDPVGACEDPTRHVVDAPNKILTREATTPHLDVESLTAWQILKASVEPRSGPLDGATPPPPDSDRARTVRTRRSKRGSTTSSTPTRGSRPLPVYPRIMKIVLETRKSITRVVTPRRRRRASRSTYSDQCSYDQGGLLPGRLRENDQGTLTYGSRVLWRSLKEYGMSRGGIPSIDSLPSTRDPAGTYEAVFPEANGHQCGAGHDVSED